MFWIRTVRNEKKKNLWQLARLRDRVENDGHLVMVIKDGDGNVLASIESVMKRRIKYLEDLMNEKKKEGEKVGCHGDSESGSVINQHGSEDSYEEDKE